MFSKEYFGVDNPIIVRGARHGERMFESLLTEEESHYAIMYGNYIKVDMSFDAERKPEGIPHFDSNSPGRALDLPCTRREVATWMKLYG